MGTITFLSKVQYKLYRQFWSLNCIKKHNYIFALFYSINYISVLVSKLHQKWLYFFIWFVLIRDPIDMGGDFMFSHCIFFYLRSNFLLRCLFDLNLRLFLAVQVCMGLLVTRVTKLPKASCFCFNLCCGVDL